MVGDTKDRWKEFNSIIDNEDLNIKEKGILLILFRYVNYRTGYADPSREKIKKISKISNDVTLDKILKSLIEKKYLIRESGKGAKVRSKYCINIPIENIGIESIGVNNIPINNNSKIPIESIGMIPIENTGQKEKKIKENIYSANDIEEVWNVYPNKKGKVKSLDYISKILKSISKDELVRTIERYKADVGYQRTHGFSNLNHQVGSTFFNGRYVDYLDCNYEDKDQEQTATDIEEELMKKAMEERRDGSGQAV